MMDFSMRVTLGRRSLIEVHPFFGTLCFYADVAESRASGPAWTNGHRIWFHPDFAARLSQREFTGVLIHEVLHCALCHVSRRQDRSPRPYNIAADIIVNEMVINAGFSLPPGHVRYTEWARFSVEEIYCLLMKQCPSELQPFMADHHGDLIYDSDDCEKGAGAEHWELAVQNAAVQGQFHSSTGHAEWERIFSQVSRTSVDWRMALWEFMARTPNDYTGWDRRFIHQGLYLEALDGESCKVFVCCDTSASIGKDELGQFLAEARAIVSSYPHIKVYLWYADTELSGPYELEGTEEIPLPCGGGGTSFIPFFEVIEEKGADPNCCAVYLTDGYGDYPDAAPDIPTLWVITAGGVDSDSIPFGSVTRLLEV